MHITNTLIYTAYASQPNSLSHLVILTGQLLNLRCFDEESNRWRLAYPEKARQRAFPYSRNSLLKQTYNTLTVHPFVRNSSVNVDNSIRTTGVTVQIACLRLRDTLKSESNLYKSMIGRLPTSKEMKQRNNGKV